MRAYLLLLVAIAITFTAVLVNIGDSPLRAADAPVAAPAAKQWEYAMVVDGYNINEHKHSYVFDGKAMNGITSENDAINLVGADGWELVAVTVVSNADETARVTTFFMKRQK